MWGGPTGYSILHKTLIVLIFTAETTSHCPARGLFQCPQNYLSPFPCYIFDIHWWGTPIFVLMSFHTPSLQQGAELDDTNLAPQFLFPKRKW